MPEENTSEQQVVVVNPPAANPSVSAESVTSSETAMQVGQLLEAHRNLTAQYETLSAKLETMEATQAEERAALATLAILDNRLLRIEAAIEQAQAEAETEAEAEGEVELVTPPEPEPEPEPQTEAETEMPKSEPPKLLQWFLK